MSLVGEGVTVRRSAELDAVNDLGLATALEHFETVERTLSYFTSLRSTQIVHMMKHMDSRGWSSLRTLDGYLAHAAAEPLTTAEAIADLLRRAGDAIAIVEVDADLDPNSQAELLTRLHDVQSALQRVTVNGPSVLVAKVDSTMGLMMRLYLRGVDVSKHPATRATLVLIAAAAMVLDMGADYAQIVGSPLGRMLGLPGG